MNAANFATLLRILCIPFIGWALHVDQYIIAFSLFLFAALSDIFDGWYARKYNCESNFGRLFDPIADKVLLSTVLIFLLASPSSDLSAILCALLLAREFIASGLRSFLSTENVVLPAGSMGKIKTIVQFVALAMCLLNWETGIYLLWLSVALSYYGLGQYLLLSTQKMRP